MKPDPHKQKKNATYKKKHGIASDTKGPASHTGIPPGGKMEPPKAKGASQGGEAALGGDGTRQARPGVWLNKDEVDERGRGVDRGGGALAHRELEPNATAQSTAKQKSMVVEEFLSESGRSYQRRKVVQNWNKYELRDEEEEEVRLRGADFGEMLRSSGRTLGEFQFKDALVLDDGPLTAAADAAAVTDAAAAASADAARFLALDCARLADALACVALNQRLQLSCALFEPTQIDAFEQEANRHTVIYQQSLSAAKSERACTGGQAESEAAMQQQQQQQSIVGASLQQTLDDDFNNILYTLHPPVVEDPSEFVAKVPLPSSQPPVTCDNAPPAAVNGDVIKITDDSAENLANASTAPAGLGKSFDIGAIDESVVVSQTSCDDETSGDDTAVDCLPVVEDERCSGEDLAVGGTGSTAGVAGSRCNKAPGPLEERSGNKPSTDAGNKSSVVDKSLSELEADLDSLLGLC